MKDNKNNNLVAGDVVLCLLDKNTYTIEMHDGLLCIDGLPFYEYRQAGGVGTFEDIHLVDFEKIKGETK